MYQILLSLFKGVLFLLTEALLCLSKDFVLSVINGYRERKLVFYGLIIIISSFYLSCYLREVSCVVVVIQRSQSDKIKSRSYIMH